MGDIVRRLVWFFIVSVAVAYAVFLVVGSAIHAKAADLSNIVQIRDELSPGAHHMSGMLLVPSTCQEISVRTQKVSTTLYRLSFQTWVEPSVPCTTSDTPRAFHAVIFAPATGVSFEAELDGVPLRAVVIPVIPSQ